ncbi:MAG: DUF4350 domain-containing protein [Dehalococcoidales bacterium]|nr:DUF4350 domain-containing protein [Dehalococcoidales bacterium]
MKTYTVLILAVALVLLTSILCVWFVPSIQTFMAGNTMWNGMRDFIRDTEAQTIDQVSQLPETPENATMVMIPYMEYTGEELGQLQSFVERGGKILLMDDYGFGNTILEYLNIKTGFWQLPLLDPLFCYRQQWLPKVVDFSPVIDNQGSNMVVVLNHAVALSDVPQDDVIAWSSPTSFLDMNSDGIFDIDEPKGPFPIAASVTFGKGQIILVSDPSLVINSMVNRNNNSAFMRALVELGGQRGEFIIDLSHLSKTPLDVSKSSISTVRDILSAPYPLLAIIATIFISVTIVMLKAGGPIGRQSKNF